MTIVPTRWGSVYAAWRGRFVVIGGRDEVAHALTAEASPAWRAALGDLPDREGVVRRRFVAISTDPTFANLLKVRVAQWKLELDGPPSPWPERDLLAAGEGGLHAFGKREVERKRRQEAGLPPDEARAADRVEPLAGRVELRYASAEEATRAGQALATAAFGGDLEASLAAALARLPQSVVGTTLVIRFDRSNFSAVDGATLSAWVARFAPAAKP
ncbi:MAG: hypothetical protein K8W52_13310 [Deltaproteobacteria bacterium]|nr:hypothetical protein [Deltaproteobacteria bacterium]